MRVEERIKKFYEKGLGLFVHYGPYIQYEHGEWAMRLRNMDEKLYEKKALECCYSSFRAENLIRAAKAAGAKYLTFTARHHDGFSMYDTRGLSEYDIMHTPGGRDILKEWIDACHENDILPFVYHTTLDWHHEAFDRDFKEYLKYLRQSVEIICRNYGTIGGFWFDGNWSKPEEDWELDELYKIIRKYQPDAIIINNTGLDEPGVFGHREIDCVTFEQGQAQRLNCKDKEKYYMGEMCYPINDHWGIADDINCKSIRQILKSMLQARNAGGNFLLGVGAKLDGSLSTIHMGFLEEIGTWIKENEDVFYSALPCDVKGFLPDFCLSQQNTLYAVVMEPGTWGDECVLKTTARNYSVFENLDADIEKVIWKDTGREADYTYDAEKKRLFLKPEPFSYGYGRIIRVAEIQCRQIRNLHTIYEE